ncbi:hypothetical protein C8R44DRAFT_893985 [Mycena epipterygia]|nr:hypothetical protein C8R44DRAFT_893985 [Mycena epipterygia]
MNSFAAQNPDLAFTHINPGLVHTSAFHFEFRWLLVPLAWLVKCILLSFVISQDEAAQYMLYALLSGERGLFLHSPKGEDISAHAFDAPYDFSIVAADRKAPTADKKMCFLFH